MFKVTLQNFDEFDRATEAWLEGVEKEITLIAKGLAAAGLRYLLENSAQYSGDFAANWNVSHTSPNTSFREGIFPGQAFPMRGANRAYVMGSAPAMRHAWENAKGKLSGYELGMPIFVANGVAHKGQAYGWMIEGNLIKFRPGNEGTPLLKTMMHLQSRYGEIGRVKAQELMALGRSL